MVFLFRGKSIINIFYLVVLAILVHLHFIVAPPVVITNTNDGVFSLLLKNYVAGLPAPALFLCYHATILIQAIRLNMVLMDLRMFQTTSYTTAMAYLLLSAMLPQWCGITPALMANFLLIWIFVKLSRLYNHPSPKTLLFNTGLIVGLSMICYHPTAILILVVLFALAVVRPFKLAEWLILLMGVLMPYYLLGAILFLKDETATFASYLPFLKLNLPLAQWTVPLIISLSVLFVILVSGLLYWSQSNKRMIIQIRKNWGAMMVMLLILLPIPFIFANGGIESAIMSLVPLAAFAGNAFANPRKLLLPNLLFLLAIIVIAINNWGFLKN